MKKLLIFALCVLLVLSFASCGETVTSSSEGFESSQSSEPQESEQESDPQEELRKKFEDCIKITEVCSDTGVGKADRFPFEVTYYRTGDDPKDEHSHQHFQLMFRLKEKFKEYTTYKIRIFTDYYNEELCNSGECDSEFIFSTTAVPEARPYRISYELYGEGMEPLISGDELWSFSYRFFENVKERFPDSTIWDDSKPIKILFSDIDSFDF